MARITTPLTATEIKAAKPKQKTYKLFDGGGLYLEVPTKQQKRWRLKYRLDGKDKLLSLGVYPTISLQEARRLRDQYKESISKGTDPLQQRKAEAEAREVLRQKQNNSFKKLANAYFEHILTLDNPVSEKYHARMKGRADKHIYPYIGTKPIDEVTRQDVHEIIARIVKAGSHETARRILLITKQILDYCVRRDHIPFNVASTISAKEEIGARTDKHFPIITDPKELKQLFIAIDEYTGDFTTKQALRLMPHVALRPANIRFAEWSEIDFDNKLWSIPADKMKMKRDFSFPLSAQALEILKETRLCSGDGQYIFPSAIRRGSAMSENTLNVALRRLGYTRDAIVSHSFRGIFSTLSHSHMQDHKCSSLAIELQLAHKDRNQIRDTYNQSDLLDERRVLVTWWSNHLTEVKANDV